MKRYFKLLFTLLKFKFSKKMMYSYDFWAVFSADTMMFVIQILMFKAIFTQVDNINGWTVNDVIIFIGTFTIVDSVGMATYFFGVISLPEKIRNGMLDLYIVKPINTLFYVSYDSMNPGSFFITLVGIGMVTYGVIEKGMEVSILTILGYVVLLALMYSLMFSLMIIVRSISFWVIKIDALMEIENQIIEFAFRIPGNVYKGVVKFILWFIIPYGIVATVPTQFLIKSFEWKNILVAVLVCIIFTTTSIKIFKKGLSQYSSASS